MYVSKSKNLNSLRPILFEISPKNVRPGSQGPPPPPAGIGLKIFEMAKKSHFLVEKN